MSMHPVATILWYAKGRPHASLGYRPPAPETIMPLEPVSAAPSRRKTAPSPGMKHGGRSSVSTGLSDQPHSATVPSHVRPCGQFSRSADVSISMTSRDLERCLLAIPSKPKAEGLSGQPAPRDDLALLGHRWRRYKERVIGLEPTTFSLEG